MQGRNALEDHFRNSRFACDTNEFLPLAFDPPRNGSNRTDKIVMGGLEHTRSETEGNVCNNSVQQEEGIVGAAAESEPKMGNNLHGPPVQPPRRQYNGQSCNKRMATSETYYNRRWNNRYRSTNAHYRPLNAAAAAAGGATTSSNPEKD